MKGPRILVIEDDQTSRMMLTRGLQRLGFETEASQDAIEAQELIRTAGPSAYQGVVVDLRMPKMDGLEFVSWLEALDPGLGCMLLTALGERALWWVPATGESPGQMRLVPLPLNPALLTALIGSGDVQA